MNHVMVLDNVLTLDQCNTIIDQYKDVLSGEQSNYRFYDLQMGENHIIESAASVAIEKYTDEFPTIKMVEDPWYCDSFRFKQFSPGKCFENWHCEHSTRYQRRIACLLLYLSDHECGTEFFNGDIIKSVAGRMVIFPTSWTHVHRGQVCPQGKYRYIMSAYINIYSSVMSSFIS